MKLLEQTLTGLREVREASINKFASEKIGIYVIDIYNHGTASKWQSFKNAFTKIEQQ